MIPGPMLIAVAPNGAEKTKLDHPELPICPEELIKTARSCLEAGAAMMHFHVRDHHGRHTLDHKIYAPVLRELETAVGENVLLQVSSESAGVYRPTEQIEQMKRLAPHCLSCGLREFIRDRTDYAVGHAFFSELYRAGVLIQYILYSPAEVEWYETLCKDGVLPGKNHLLLFVLGRYRQATIGEFDLRSYVTVLKRNSPWMVCGFGMKEHKIVSQAAKLGGHARVGFENNHQLPDGRPAPDNAALVQLASEAARFNGRSPGDKRFAESLY
ncbi:MAG: 3-keto-5-aminohexanoate cleavage protein, partial [Desulforhopalus sp.]